MKSTLCFLILVLVALPALASLELCEEVTDCSEAMKNKCSEMSEPFKDSGNKEFELSCMNGLCMCNIKFEVAEVSVVNETCQLKDKVSTQESTS